LPLPFLLILASDMAGRVLALQLVTFIFGGHTRAPGGACD